MKKAREDVFSSHPPQPTLRLRHYGLGGLDIPVFSQHELQGPQQRCCGGSKHISSSVSDERNAVNDTVISMCSDLAIEHMASGPEKKEHAQMKVNIEASILIKCSGTDSSSRISPSLKH